MPRYDIIYFAADKVCRDLGDACKKARLAGFRLLEWNGQILIWDANSGDGARFFETGIDAEDLECQCRQN